MIVKRALTVVIVLLVSAQGAYWGFVGVLLWMVREGLFEPAPHLAVTELTALAIALVAVALLNLASVVAFLVRPRPLIWWTLTSIQVADAAILTVVYLVNPASFPSPFLVFTVAAAVTALLLVAARPWPIGTRRQP